MSEKEKISDEMKRFCLILRHLYNLIRINEIETNFDDVLHSTENPQSQKNLLDLQRQIQTSRDKINELITMKTDLNDETKEIFDDLQTIRTKLKDNLIEEKFRWKIAQRYGQKWQTNHIAQWIEMLNEKEKIDLKTIENYEEILRQTDVVHRETVEILREQNDDLKLKNQFWFERFQNETDRFERELKSFQHDFHQMRNEREDLLNEYERMRIVVDEDHQRKERERIIAEKRRREEEAIKRIQSWWRGILVRRFKMKKSSFYLSKI